MYGQALQKWLKVGFKQKLPEKMGAFYFFIVIFEKIEVK
ncbi:hypothetical protein GGR02_003423 [Anoxybacillus voinovskiensis]|uniref:Uncharacterized protein n=1 Tax=Anoxybacteroides voinovskiense TaxID=230470 RepID=A0A840DR66_9BACL|nr:hypothetical protein [Anoxybacillus voinovskiensis]